MWLATRSRVIRASASAAVASGEELSGVGNTDHATGRSHWTLGFLGCFLLILYHIASNRKTKRISNGNANQIGAR